MIFSSFYQKTPSNHIPWPYPPKPRKRNIKCDIQKEPQKNKDRKEKEIGRTGGGFYLLCSGRGCPTASWRTWAPVKVSLLPWIWKVRGLLPPALVTGRCASEANCPMLTTSPATNRKGLIVFRVHSVQHVSDSHKAHVSLILQFLQTFPTIYHAQKLSLYTQSLGF
jgi:hypothetical protein